MLGKGKISKDLKSALRQIQGQKGYYKNSNRYVEGGEFKEMKELEELINKINVEYKELSIEFNKNRRI